MNIIQCKNADEASKQAAKALEEAFDEYKDSNILFLSSGGSSLKILNNINPEVLTEKLIVTVLDTRLEVDLKDENYEQLAKTEFYKKAAEKGVQFLDSSAFQTLSLSEAGKNFDTLLKNWLANHQAAKIVATIGMGVDGHIAGIMPFPDDKKSFDSLFVDTNNLAVAYDVPSGGKFPKRLTVTYPFLSKIDRVVSYITGDDKRPKLLELAGKNFFSNNQFPGIILRKLNKVSIFTDLEI